MPHRTGPAAVEPSTLHRPSSRNAGDTTTEIGAGAGCVGTIVDSTGGMVVDSTGAGSGGAIVDSIVDSSGGTVVDSIGGGSAGTFVDSIVGVVVDSTGSGGGGAMVVGDGAVVEPAGDDAPRDGEQPATRTMAISTTNRSTRGRAPGRSRFDR